MISDFSQQGINDSGATGSRLFIRNSVIRSATGTGIAAVALTTSSASRSTMCIRSTTASAPLPATPTKSASTARSSRRSTSAGLEADTLGPSAWIIRLFPPTPPGCRTPERCRSPIPRFPSTPPALPEPPPRSATTGSSATPWPEPRRPLAWLPPITASNSRLPGSVPLSRGTVKQGPRPNLGRLPPEVLFLETIAGGSTASALWIFSLRAISLRRLAGLAMRDGEGKSLDWDRSRRFRRPAIGDHVERGAPDRGGCRGAADFDRGFCRRGVFPAGRFRLQPPGLCGGLPGFHSAG